MTNLTHFVLTILWKGGYTTNEEVRLLEVTRLPKPPCQAVMESGFRLSCLALKLPQHRDRVVSILWTILGSSRVLLICSPPPSILPCFRSLQDALQPHILLTSDSSLCLAWEPLVREKMAGGESDLACVSGLPFRWLCLSTEGCSFLYSLLCSQVPAAASSLPDSGCVFSPGVP